jgi:hypothetical protein
MSYLIDSTSAGRRGFGLRSLLLAGALALLLIPVMESRASAAGGVHPFCYPSATSDQSKWVPANSYCQKAQAGYYPQLYGSFFWSDATTGRPGNRFCSIIDVYSLSTGLAVHRYKSCTTSGSSVRATVTNGAYGNRFAYAMFAYVYNGSSVRLPLAGWAAGTTY